MDKNRADNRYFICRYSNYRRRYRYFKISRCSCGFRYTEPSLIKAEARVFSSSCQAAWSQRLNIRSANRFKYTVGWDTAAVLRFPRWWNKLPIVYNYDADLEVSDTCVRSFLLSWVELSWELTYMVKQITCSVFGNRLRVKVMAGNGVRMHK